MPSPSPSPRPHSPATQRGRPTHPSSGVLARCRSMVGTARATARDPRPPGARWTRRRRCPRGRLPHPPAQERVRRVPITRRSSWHRACPSLRPRQGLCGLRYGDSGGERVGHPDLPSVRIRCASSVVTYRMPETPRRNIGRTSRSCNGNFRRSRKRRCESSVGRYSYISAEIDAMRGRDGSRRRSRRCGYRRRSC